MTAVYGPFYGYGYGGFPFGVLDAMVELDLAGTWTDITTCTLQREGTSPPIAITRGRPDETAQATPSTCTMQSATASIQVFASPAAAAQGSFALPSTVTPPSGIHAGSLPTAITY